MTRNARPTGTLAAIITVLLLVASQLGLELSPEIATALVIVPAGVVSYFLPRWAEKRGILFSHPAALSGAAATLLVWVGTLAGIDVDTATALAIVGGVTALVSIFTPRDS